MVEIADNGAGISAAIQPHIFEPFFTTKKVGEGARTRQRFADCEEAQVRLKSARNPATHVFKCGSRWRKDQFTTPIQEMLEFISRNPSSMRGDRSPQHSWACSSRIRAFVQRMVFRINRDSVCFKVRYELTATSERAT